MRQEFGRSAANPTAMQSLLSPRRPLTALAAIALLVLGLVVTTLLPRGQAAPLADPRLDLPPLQAPGEWFDSQRGVEGASIDYAGTLAESAAIAERTRAIDPAVAGLEWDLLGPTEIGGRVVDLALVPGRPDEVWVATASGGVWHSADAGSTYSPRWDPELTQALGAMAAGPDGTLYVGTGEANPGGGSVVYGGTGLYVSRDDGASWQLSGLPESGAFGRIVVDPSDGDTVYAAAAGDLFVPGGERGLYRSPDAGQTWELIFPQADTVLPNRETTGAVDVAVDPSDSDRILVAMWDHHRTPEKRVYAGPGSSVWLTEDGGTTWTHVTDIALGEGDRTRNDLEDRLYTPGEETGRIGVAFAPSDPSRVYAMIANTLDGTHGAWFSSDDGGRSFTRSEPFGLAANNSSYGWWFARIFVDPRNADHLYAAGLEVIESLDGGSTFLPQSNTTALVVTGANQAIVHSDQHAMVWSPDVPGLVYLGNDGGVYRSAANGAAGTWVTGVSQGWTQHYSVDVDEQTAQYVVSGLQDNLCMHHVGDVEAGSAAWMKYGFCGDGIVTRVDPGDPTTTYYCSQYGGCGRAKAGAPLLVGGMRMPSDRYGWLADIQFDPTDPDTIYTAGAQLHRSTNEGTAFTTISGDLSSQPEQTDPNTGYRLRGVVTTIATHPDGDTVWVGTDEGRLWVTHSASTLPPVSRGAMQANGDGWTLVDDGDATTTTDNDGDLGLPERTWITSITTDPADPTGKTAWGAYSGFRQGEEGAQLFRTTDGGDTFTNVSGDLPGAPINDVILVDGDPMVATDVGVFLSTDGGDSWLRVGDLPAVPVLELRHHVGTNTLTAATFGHGVRRTTLPGDQAVGLELALHD